MFSENCFGDIDSSDCPTGSSRRGKLIEVDDEEGMEQFSGDNMLGPHPSVLLKEIFSHSKPHIKTFKKQKRQKSKDKKSRPNARQSKTGVIIALKTLIKCMTDPTDTACTGTYR